MKPKVLYVEDEVHLRDEIAFILELEGFEVRTADDGEMGWEAIEEFKPDIVVTDIKMPKMTGLELLAKIRSLKSSNLPVIVVSGFVTSSWINEATALGAVAYLSKPFSIKNLLAEITNIIP